MVTPDGSVSSPFGRFFYLSPSLHPAASALPSLSRSRWRMEEFCVESVLDKRGMRIDPKTLPELLHVLLQTVDVGVHLLSAALHLGQHVVHQVLHLYLCLCPVLCKTGKEKPPERLHTAVPLVMACVTSRFV